MSKKVSLLADMDEHSDVALMERPKSRAVAVRKGTAAALQGTNYAPEEPRALMKPMKAMKPAAPQPKSYRVAQTRVGKRNISFFVEPDVFRTLKDLAVVQNRPLGDVMNDAVSEYFKKKRIHAA